MEHEDWAHLFRGLCFQKGPEDRGLERTWSMNIRDPPKKYQGPKVGAIAPPRGLQEEQFHSTGNLGTLT